MNSTNNMQDLELWFKTNAKKATKKSTPITFEITNETGVAITKEGPVTYEAGHYLVSNGPSPPYPIAPTAFMALYDFIPEQVGVATPKAIEKLSKLATDDGSITTSWGVLHYRSGLDYIVRHSADDYGVVSNEIFAQSYFIINEKLPFFVKTLVGKSYCVELDPFETSAVKVVDDIIKQLPEEICTYWQVICEGKCLKSCHHELAQGVAQYFSKLATIHVVNRQHKRPREEEFTSDSDSDSTITKAYDDHRKKCKLSNTSTIHGGAYIENGVSACTLCDEKI